MKIWTAHTRPQTTPVLLPEAFSWGRRSSGRSGWRRTGHGFPPCWRCAPAWWSASPCRSRPRRRRARARLAAGLFGRDLCRWSLERRGFTLAQVVGGRTEEEALGRLLDQRPD